MLFVPPQGGEGGTRRVTGEDAIPDTQTGCRGASPYRFAESRTVWREIAQTRRGHSPPRFASQIARHPQTRDTSLFFLDNFSVFLYNKTNVIK